MLSVAWSLFAWTVLVQPQQVSAPSALQLYQQASQALQAKRVSEAETLLEMLVAQHPNVVYSPLAAIRLSECYLAEKRTCDALKLLQQWSGPIVESTQSDAVAQIEPKLSDHFLLLVQKTLAACTDKECELVQQWLRDCEQRPDLINLRAILLRHLAKQRAQAQQWAESRQLLMQIGDAASNEHDRLLRNFELPLAILKSNPALEQIQQLHHLLTNANLSLSQLTSLNMAYAEALRELNDLSGSAAALDQLSVTIETRLGNSLNNDSNDSADWQATVDLRRAELQYDLKNFAAAKQLATRAVELHRHYRESYRYRFVLAKCFIADVELQSARAELLQIVADSRASADSAARALWMIGEISFLQRQYLAAIGEYQQVLQVSEQFDWHARALIQMGKCHELLKQPSEALACYHASIQQYPNSDVTALANTRILALTPMPAESTESAATTDNSIKIQR